jgi:hypothetical protein
LKENSANCTRRKTYINQKTNMKKTTVAIVLSLVLMISLPMLVTNVEASVRSVDRPYTSRSTMMQQWFTLESQHPTLITHEKIGESVQGNDLYIFRIGNPSGGAVMWDGSTHGCEDTGTEASYWFTKWLVESSSQRAKNILAGNYWLVIPYVNYDRADGRTNMHGVDLNRNFVYNWGTGSSSPGSETYRGPSPASEPETQAVRYAQQKYNPKVYFNLHTGMHMIGYSAKNSAASTIGTSIGQRYDAEIRLRGITKQYSIGTRSPSGGFAASDAYALGACAFLFETQTWDELPATLSEWRSQWYPNVEAVILAALESVQNAQASSSPTPTTSPTAPTTTSTTTATNFDESFESRNFNDWDGTTTTSGESSSFTSSMKYDGAYGALFASNGNGGYEKAFCYETLRDQSELYSRGYVYVSRSGIGKNNDRVYFIIFKAGNEGVAYVGWRMVDGVVRWNLLMRDGNGWVDAYSSSSPASNRWYSVELHWKSGVTNGGGELYVDDHVVCSISRINTAAFGGADTVRFGLAEAYNCASTTVYVDDFVISTTQLS